MHDSKRVCKNSKSSPLFSEIQRNAGNRGMAGDKVTRQAEVRNRQENGWTLQFCRHNRLSGKEQLEVSKCIYSGANEGLGKQVMGISGIDWHYCRAGGIGGI